MTIDEVIDALEKVKIAIEQERETRTHTLSIDPVSCQLTENQKTKGGYFRTGNVAVKIAEITELK